MKQQRTMTASRDSASYIDLYVGLPLLSDMVYYTSNAINLQNEEEDFHFVLLEDHQQIPSADADRSIYTYISSPQRYTWTGVRHGVLGLLMTSIVMSAGIGGYYAIANLPTYLGAGYPTAPMLLVDVALFTLWYLVAYVASWSLLGRVHQAFTSPRTRDTIREEETRLFVDTVMWHSSMWNYVCLVLSIAVVPCYVVAFQATRW